MKAKLVVVLMLIVLITCKIKDDVKADTSTEMTDYQRQFYAEMYGIPESEVVSVRRGSYCPTIYVPSSEADHFTIDIDTKPNLKRFVDKLKRNGTMLSDENCKKFIFKWFLNKKCVDLGIMSEEEFNDFVDNFANYTTSYQLVMDDIIQWDDVNQTVTINPEYTNAMVNYLNQCNMDTIIITQNPVTTARVLANFAYVEKQVCKLDDNLDNYWATPNIATYSKSKNGLYLGRWYWDYSEQVMVQRLTSLSSDKTYSLGYFENSLIYLFGKEPCETSDSYIAELTSINNFTLSTAKYQINDYVWSQKSFNSETLSKMYIYSFTEEKIRSSFDTGYILLGYGSVPCSNKDAETSCVNFTSNEYKNIDTTQPIEVSYDDVFNGDHYKQYVDNVSYVYNYYTTNNTYPTDYVVETYKQLPETTTGEETNNNVVESYEFSFIQTLKNVASELGDVPKFISEVFSFLPPEIETMLIAAIAIIILCRIVGR